MVESKPDVQLVYIAGYGRSGSTVLDMLLSSHPQVFGAGELNHLFRRFLDNGECACGNALPECDFWQSVLHRVFLQLPSLDCRRAASVTLAAETVVGLRRHRETYTTLWRHTLDAIRQVSGCPTIVDSSKNSRIVHHRLSHLRSDVSERVKAIHLVRDPRAVMWSTLRGSDRRLEQGNSRRSSGGSLRTLLSWTYANLSVEASHREPGRLDYQRLRYEDLVQSPQETLEHLERFLEMDSGTLSSLLDNTSGFSPGHGVGGNRMRRSGPVVLKFDDQWQRQLPGFSRRLACLVSPLLHRYGYDRAA